jgi:hypothetical protein
MTLVKQDKAVFTLLEEKVKQELKVQFIELRAKGWSNARISRKFKVSKFTV